MEKRNFNSKIKETNYIHDDEYFYDVLRTNIRVIRRERKLTQQDLADMTELSREYICDIENKNRNKHPSIAVVGRIAEALSTEMMTLFDESIMEDHD